MLKYPPIKEHKFYGFQLHLYLKLVNREQYYYLYKFRIYNKYHFITSVS